MPILRFFDESSGRPLKDQDITHTLEATHEEYVWLEEVRVRHYYADQPERLAELLKFDWDTKPDYDFEDTCYQLLHDALVERRKREAINKAVEEQLK